MRRLPLRGGLIFALAVLASAQLVILGFRTPAAPAGGSPWFEVGQSLAGIQVVDSLERRAHLPNAETTVVLVFNSVCGHCLTVAPLWASWTKENAARVRILAISSEPLDSAKGFVQKHDWSVEVMTVEASEFGSPESRLTQRTPWVFVLDDTGKILAEGHGSSLAQLASTGNTLVGVEPE